MNIDAVYNFNEMLEPLRELHEITENLNKMLMLAELDKKLENLRTVTENFTVEPKY